MGKRQHQKDKMYLTYTEWSTLYGGKKSGTEAKTFRRLPFDHCCVSLLPFKHPYCDQDGNIFDLEAIVKYHKKYKCNPVNGKPLDMTSLVKLNIAKDQEDKYQCPILRKHITSNSHIAAIATTGNVFLYEAVEQLNVKTKCFRDLLTDETFNKKDIIMLQDPANLEKFNLSNFFHIKSEHTLEDREEEALMSNKESVLKTVNNEARAILDELNREYTPATTQNKEKVVADKYNAAHYSTGKVAASFTSTAMPVETKHEPAIIEEDVVRYGLIKKKGYVRLTTNFGPLNIELHCDMVPKTCENFLKHCQKGYYNGTIFHRSIRHFMIQGGDPTGTGEGGESIWGKSFENEIRPQLTHTGRGILSMVNAGPKTNKSQFFITYRSCKHLDGKHTVFGHVVGGLDTLNTYEKIEVDNKDRPIQNIVIKSAQVFIDPYKDADDELAAGRGASKDSKEKEESTDGRGPNKFRSGIGKYINPKNIISRVENKEIAEGQPVKKLSKRLGYNFGDFKEW